MSHIPAVEVGDVFTPGGLPTHTYLSRNLAVSSGQKSSLEQVVHTTLATEKKIISIAGPTKCGKTVLIRKMFGAETNSLWIEGGHISSIDDVYISIAEQLQVPIESTQGQSISHEQSTALEVALTAKPMGVGSEYKENNANKQNEQKTGSTKYAGPTIQLLLKKLKENKTTLIIDDFHFISPAIQTSLIQSLKSSVFDGLKVILLLIPHRIHEAAKAEMDIGGRVKTIVIPNWENKELYEIAEKGFAALNCTILPTTVQRFILESNSSPHLMQEFCLRSCVINNILFRPNTKQEIKIEYIEDFFIGIASNLPSEIINELRKGPPRTNRKDRDKVDGGVCDTYEAIIEALKKLASESEIPYSSLKTELQSILSEAPQQHEVTRALENMDEIAKSKDGEPVIDFVKDKRTLYLVDPFFKFSLKWAQE